MNKLQGPLSPDGKWQWNGKTWVSYTPPKKEGPISQDGKWQWDGKTWVAYPPPKKSRKGWVTGSVVGGILAFILLVAVTGAASSSGSGGNNHKAASNPVAAAPKTTPKPTPTSTPATPAPTSTSPGVPAAKPAPAPTPKPQPTLLFSASGTESGESQAFTPPQHYEVQYAWQCDPSAGSGNFIMNTDDQNGQSEWDGVNVNRLAASGNGTVDGDNFGGQHNVHIAVISECNWTINVLQMPS